MHSPYYSLNDYTREVFGKKLYKLSLQSGCTCPNRDGTLGSRGCIFCSAGGSGDFAAPAALPISEQLKHAKERIAGKLPKGEVGYIAYFQSFTNTYGNLNRLKSLWDDAAEDEEVSVISIATRPDCLGADVLEALSELNRKKPVWVELGLQTIHEKTASYIRRGYSLNVYEKAVKNLHEKEITVITHVILGLPGETTDLMLETVRYVGIHSEGRPDGIKLQLLHVLKGTDLANDWETGKFQTMEASSYFSLLGTCLEILPETMVIHRLTGDGPKSLLLSPLWTGNKKWVMNTLRKELSEKGIRQGSGFQRT